MRPNDIVDNISRQLWDLFESCWNRNPAARPKALEVLSRLEHLQEPPQHDVLIRPNSPTLLRSSTTTTMERPCRPSSPLNPHRPQSPVAGAGKHVGDGIRRPSSPLNPHRLPQPKSPDSLFIYPSFGPRSGEGFRRPSSPLRPVGPNLINNGTYRAAKHLRPSNPLKTQLSSNIQPEAPSIRPIGLSIPMNVGSAPVSGVNTELTTNLTAADPSPIPLPAMQCDPSSALPLPGTPIELQHPLLSRLRPRKDRSASPAAASATGSAASHRSTTRRNAKDFWEGRRGPGL